MMSGVGTSSTWAGASEWGSIFWGVDYGYGYAADCGGLGDRCLCGFRKAGEDLQPASDLEPGRAGRKTGEKKNLPGN